MSRDQQTRAQFGKQLEAHFRTHYAELVRRWRARAGGTEDAEDLIQQGYTALYRTYAEGGIVGDGDAVLGALVHTAILNAWRDRIRKEARSAGVIVRASPQGESGSEASEYDLLNQIQDIAVRTEDELAVRHLLERVMAVLSPHWRGVLAMLLGEHTPKEIETALGRNGHTLRREARRQFCRALGRFIDVDPLAGWISRQVCVGTTAL